jgi:hypothetical protein
MPQARRGRTEGGGDGGHDLSPDALAPKPGEEGARLLIGILGEGGDGDSVRLYLDLEFRKSYDIPREAVLRRERLSADQSPLGVESSALWVRPDTVLTLHQTETRKVEDEFLAGDFTAGGSFAAQAAGPQVGGVAMTPHVTIASCGVVGCPQPTLAPTICPSDLDACPSRLQPCISRMPCPTTLPVRCPSILIRCPTLAQPFCPSRFQARCPSQIGPRCPSQWLPCQSALTHCPSLPVCPSEVTVCPSGLACGGFDPGGDPFGF